MTSGTYGTILSFEFIKLYLSPVIYNIFQFLFNKKGEHNLSKFLNLKLIFKVVQLITKISIICKWSSRILRIFIPGGSSLEILHKQNFRTMSNVTGKNGKLLCTILDVFLVLVLLKIPWNLVSFSNFKRFWCFSYLFYYSYTSKSFRYRVDL